MNIKQLITYSSVAFMIVLLASCRKDGMNTAEARKLQHQWELFSHSSATDYFNGYPVTWTVTHGGTGNYLNFGRDSYFYQIYLSGTTKYQYKLSGNQILYLLAAPDRATTPVYTDTTTIRYVDDHLLVLYKRNIFISGAYSYMYEYIDSLKR